MAMRKGLFELRLKSNEGIGRVFFGVLENRRIVMLHLFMKKTEKTPHKDGISSQTFKGVERC